MNKIFLLGDSHAIALRRSFIGRGWKVFGGMLFKGRDFELPFFEQNEREITFIDRQAQDFFASALKEADVSTLDDLDIPIVTTIGFNSHRLTNALFAQNQRAPAGEIPVLSNAVMAEIVATVRQHALAFYSTLPASRTYAVRSPQRSAEHKISVLQHVEDLFAEMLSSLGVNIIDVRSETTGPDGTLRSEYFTTREGDNVHANDAYGAVVVDALITQLRANGQLPPDDPS